MRLSGVFVAIALLGACGKIASESDPDGAAGGGGFIVSGGGGSANTPGGGGTGSFGGEGGMGGFGSGTGYMVRLGRQCVTDPECSPAEHCELATSDLFGGEGPAKGYCTASCAQDPSICAQFNQTGAAPTVCHEFSNGEAFCLEGCFLGPDGLTQFDPNKCHGRQEAACRPLFDANGAFTTAACFPQCNSDADCGNGLACNPGTGLCTKTPPTGQPLGAPCAGSAGSSCEGLCIPVPSTSGVLGNMCTELCTLGAAPSCGWSGPGTGPCPAACLFVAYAAGNPGPGIGDLGFCGELCDCDLDCAAPGLGCVPWSGPDAPPLEAFFQRKGYCGDPADADAGTLPCVNDGG